MAIVGANSFQRYQLRSLISYLPGGAQRSTWAPNTVCLLWELLQCNKNFRNFIYDSGRCLDLMISLLTILAEGKENTHSQGFLRLCVYVLQTISAEPRFGSQLNTVLQSQEPIPSGLRIQGFQGTYGDFLIMVCFYSSLVFEIVPLTFASVDTLFNPLLSK